MKLRKKMLVLLVLASVMLTGCSSKTSSSGESKAYKIGIIKYMDQISLDEAREGFIEEMEKNNIDVEYIDKNENGDMSLVTVVPQKMIEDEVDLVYAIATPAAQGAKNTISDIPIVFSAVTDPVAAELVESIEKPNTNVTGVSDYIDPSVQIDEFLKLYPDVKSFGVIYNVAEQNSQVQVKELEKVMKDKNLKLEAMGISSINDIPQSIVSLSKKVDALFALTDNMVASAAPIVSENLLKYNIPSLSAEEGQVKNGLLMSEGVNYKEQGAQAARMAIRILNGEDVKEMPVEYNEKNLKKVNKETAEKLGVDLNNEIFKDAEVVK